MSPGASQFNNTLLHKLASMRQTSVRPHRSKRADGSCTPRQPMRSSSTSSNTVCSRSALGVNVRQERHPLATCVPFQCASTNDERPIEQPCSTTLRHDCPSNTQVSTKASNH